MVRQLRILLYGLAREYDGRLHRREEDPYLHVTKVFLGGHGAVDRSRVLRARRDNSVSVGGAFAIRGVANVPRGQGFGDGLVPVMFPGGVGRWV